MTKEITISINARNALSKARTRLLKEAGVRPVALKDAHAIPTPLGKLYHEASTGEKQLPSFRPKIGQSYVDHQQEQVIYATRALIQRADGDLQYNTLEIRWKIGRGLIPRTIKRRSFTRQKKHHLLTLGVALEGRSEGKMQVERTDLIEELSPEAVDQKVLYRHWLLNGKSPLSPLILLGSMEQPNELVTWEATVALSSEKELILKKNNQIIRGKYHQFSIVIPLLSNEEYKKVSEFNLTTTWGNIDTDTPRTDDERSTSTHINPIQEVKALKDAIKKALRGEEVLVRYLTNRKTDGIRIEKQPTWIMDWKARHTPKFQKGNSLQPAFFTPEEKSSIKWQRRAEKEASKGYHKGKKVQILRPEVRRICPVP